MTKRCIGARKVLKVSPTSPVNFSRETPAYLQDGTEVASGVPRIEHPFGKNLNVNGDFKADSNGDGIADRWSKSSTNSKNFRLLNGVQYWTPTVTGAWSNSIVTTTNIMPKKGHIYYCSIQASNIYNILFGEFTALPVGIAIIKPSGNYSWRTEALPNDGTHTRVTIVANIMEVETSVSNLILIDLTATYGAGNEPTLEQCDLMYRDYYKNKGVFAEEGTTNLIPANRQKFVGWGAYQGATVTLTQNQAVPEWGAIDATRIQTSGGTSNTKYALSVSIPDGSVTKTLYVKNNGVYPFTSLLTNPTLRQTVQPGEVVHINKTGAKSTTASPVWRFDSGVAEHDLDIIVWRPQVEQKAYCTSWTPSTRNDEVLIVPSLSAKTISVDVGFVLDSNDYATRESKTILALGNYQIVTWESNGAVKLYDGTSYYNIITAIVKNSKVRIGLVEENGEIKVYWNGELKLTIEGTLPNSDIYLGTNTSGERHVNAYFGNLHLASKPLQVTSMSPLPIDQFTLYSALNQGNLEASQGYYENFWCLPVKYDGTTTIHIRKDDDDNV